MTVQFAIDTSTDACSLALKKGSSLWCFHEKMPRQHHERILSLIQALFSKGNVSFNELNYLVVGVGPGSFVGTRLACAIAQGVAGPFNIPVLPVSSLQLSAQTLYREQGMSTAVFVHDAKIQEAYVGGYRVDSQGIMQATVLDKALAVSELANWCEDQDVNAIYTDAVGWLKEILPEAVIKESLRPNAQYLLDFLSTANAEDFIAPAALSPVYLRKKSQWVKAGQSH